MSFYSVLNNGNSRNFTFDDNDTFKQCKQEDKLARRGLEGEGEFKNAKDFIQKADANLVNKVNENGFIIAAVAQAPAACKNVMLAHALSEYKQQNKESVLVFTDNAN